jgi:hypothetical protein
MAKILSQLINEDLDYRFSMIHEPFKVELKTLDDLGLQAVIEIPKGFIHDYESSPFKSLMTSKTGGVVHDYLSRSDSEPVVTKKICADCYFEIMEGSDRLKATGNFQLFKFWLRRWAKYSAVLVAPGYFHKHKVFATYEEMSDRPILEAP